MDIRELQLDDAGRVREVARESLAASYGHTLDEEQIGAAVEHWYDEDGIAELLSADESLFLVAENDGVAGYVQGEIVTGDTVVGNLHWLHVRPDERGQGVGSQLLGETIDRMEKAGASVVRGWVIEENEDGIAFYEEHGFSTASSDTAEINGEEHEEVVLERHVTEADERVTDRIDGPEGEQLYVDYAGGETGTFAPFYPTYRDEALTERFGWLCGNCNATETAMGSIGRIECGNCENARKATRWDRSYL